MYLDNAFERMVPSVNATASNIIKKIRNNLICVFQLNLHERHSVFGSIEIFDWKFLYFFRRPGNALAIMRINKQ